LIQNFVVLPELIKKIFLSRALDDLKKLLKRFKTQDTTSHFVIYVRNVHYVEDIITEIVNQNAPNYILRYIISEEKVSYRPAFRKEPIYSPGMA
jgi:hypothetical protein